MWEQCCDGAIADQQAVLFAVRDPLGEAPQEQAWVQRTDVPIPEEVVCFW